MSFQHHPNQEEQYINNAKKTIQIIDEIRNAEKELQKKLKKYTESIESTAQNGLSLSQTFKSFIQKFEDSDISNIEKVCGTLKQCGDLLFNFVKLMDKMQIEIGKRIQDPLQSFLEGELAISSNAPKIDSFKSINEKNEKKIQESVAIHQMALYKFEIESLGQFCSMYEITNDFVNGMTTLTEYKNSHTFCCIEKEKLMLAFDESLQTEMSQFRNYFGISVKELLANENRMNAQIPLGLEKAFRYLYENGMEKEGLFRISSTPHQIDFMKTKFLPVNYSNEDPFLVANVCKSFFKELPGSLIPLPSVKTFIQWYELLDRLEHRKKM